MQVQIPYQFISRVSSIYSSHLQSKQGRFMTTNTLLLPILQWGREIIDEQVQLLRFVRLGMNATIEHYVSLFSHSLVILDVRSQASN